MAPKKHPTLYDATEMPWVVDLCEASEGVRPAVPAGVVSISGNVAVKLGNVNRPPMTPWSYPNSLFPSLVILQYLKRKRRKREITARNLQEIQSSNESNGDIESGAAQAQIPLTEQLHGFERRLLDCW